EFMIDENGKQILIMKKEVEKASSVVESEITMDDFEMITDANGETVLRMKADVALKKGLTGLEDTNFELFVDEKTGKQSIRVKDDDQSGKIEIVIDIVTGKQKIIKRTIDLELENTDIIESQLNQDDFERIVDETTGEVVLKLKKGAAARKGLTDLLDVEFEMVFDEKTQQQKIIVKGGASQGASGDAQFELVTDASGKTTIKLKKERPPSPDLEVTEKAIDISDFDVVTDATGKTVLKLKADVAKRSGMMGLLDAEFETYIDSKTGKEAIRVKGNGIPGQEDIKFTIETDATGKQVLKMVQEIPKQIQVTDSDVSRNDFEEVIDAKTGKKVLRMKKEVARRKGFVDMDQIDFEVIIDAETGKETVKIKKGSTKTKGGNVTYEMVIDPTTGQQTLRMKETVEVKFETVENDLAIDDFVTVIDEVTGEKVLKLTAEAAARKGLTDLQDVEFEVYVDPTTGVEQIRMKGGAQTGKSNDQKFELFVDAKTGLQKIRLKRPKGRTPPPIEKAISTKDFEKVIDPTTGKEYYRLTDEAAKLKGLTNLQDMEFDVEIDPITGQSTMKVRTTAAHGKKVEIIIDPTTGEQIIRVVQQTPVLVEEVVTAKIDLDADSFTVYWDPITGEEQYKLRDDLLESYGLENVEFEAVVDEKTGKKSFRMKPMISKDGKVYELVQDPTTGKQILQVKETLSNEEVVARKEMQEAKSLAGDRDDEADVFTTGISKRTKQKPGITSSPDEFGESTPSPLEQRNETKDLRKSRPMKIKSASGKEYEIEWTSDDEKELDGLSVYEQRKRKEQLLAEKKRKVAEMKRQLELGRKRRVENGDDNIDDQYSDNQDEMNEDMGEKHLRQLDERRGEMTDAEYQAQRKQLFTDRAKRIKAVYERKVERLKRQGVQSLGEEQRLIDEQIRVEEQEMLKMMSEEEREDYYRQINEEKARQRRQNELERQKRDEMLKASIQETKERANAKAAELIALEFQKRSSTANYAELKNLTIEQRISQAFTYSYFSLINFISKKIKKTDKA
ncbi:unnamed protein product, partial [Didymodactylos carnosus]